MDIEIVENVDQSTNKKYTNESILKGILHHSYFSNVFNGNAASDCKVYSVGTGNRREVAKALGFSDNPTQAECDSKMATINIEAYPGRKITIHKDLTDEVQRIFAKLKQAGVQLNEYCGGYCFRHIVNPGHKGPKPLSMHAFGCAIDINYNLNPFVENGKPWSSGGDDTPRGIMRTYQSPIVQAFASEGWGWGGRYGDYMHFSKANGG